MLEAARQLADTAARVGTDLDETIRILRAIWLGQQAERRSVRGARRPPPLADGVKYGLLFGRGEPSATRPANAPYEFVLENPIQGLAQRT